MACIKVKVSNPDPSLDANIKRIGNGISVAISDIRDNIEVSIANIGEELKAAAVRLGSNLKARCSVICTIDDVLAFLEVSPNEIQWITDEQGIYFEVESNVEWIIVKE